MIQSKDTDRGREICIKFAFIHISRSLCLYIREIVAVFRHRGSRRRPTIPQGGKLPEVVLKWEKSRHPRPPCGGDGTDQNQQREGDCFGDIQRRPCTHVKCVQVCQGQAYSNWRAAIQFDVWCRPQRCRTAGKCRQA